MQQQAPLAGMPVAPSRCHALVIENDDEPAPQRVYEVLAQDATLSVQHVTWNAVARSGVGQYAVRLIVAVLADARVAPILDAIERENLATPLIAVIPEGDEATLNVAARVADDFLFSPIRPLELRHRLARMLAGPRVDLRSVSDRLVEEIGMTKLVGRNPTFVRAVRLVPRFARASATVLITGETGTGKEVCARAIHHLGARTHAPFVTVDCGATPDQLFENELFGHARGAFTDAHRDQKGLVALAEGGTLFLDEVDSLSLGAQAKLLRFLQDQTFRPLGSERSERANVRIIAACNRDLDACVRNKEFRADLFFRLNILRVQLPPLRERRDDIPLLVQGMIDEFRADEGTHAKSAAAAALRMLTSYDWPGNIRELANVVHRAVVECDGDTILPEHVDLPVAPRPEPLHFRAARAVAVATFERTYVEELLRKHGGNVTHAAREAQQDRRAFGRVIKKYKIDRGAL
jgi:DNA-binding NtrC family response regulator